MTPTLPKLPDISHLDGLSVLEHEPLAPRTTWKLGGPARWLVEVAAKASLVPLLAALRAAGVRWAVLGNGSNVLVSDRGFDGAVLVLTGALAALGLQRDVFPAPRAHRVTAGGGASLTRLLRLAKDEALDGLWVLGGVPGTIGGAVKMNAGTRWGEVSQTIVEAELVTADGIVVTPAAELGLAYRHSAIGADTVIASATFAVADAAPSMRDKLDEVLAYRRASQPLQLPSCGSVFANPPGASAGALIEQVGLKGHRIGELEISTQHANWIVNHGAGTAADALALIELCIARVRDTLGVELRPEVQRFGTFEDGGGAA